MSLTIGERKLMAKFVRNGYPINFVAEMFEAHRNTVSYWAKQDLRSVNDIPKTYSGGKITVEVEATILCLISLGYGTARIQQGLIKLPDYMRIDLEICV